jgi:hypothetical protein
VPLGAGCRLLVSIKIKDGAVVAPVSASKVVRKLTVGSSATVDTDANCLLLAIGFSMHDSPVVAASWAFTADVNDVGHELAVPTNLLPDTAVNRFRFCVYPVWIDSLSA